MSHTWSFLRLSQDISSTRWVISSLHGSCVHIIILDGLSCHHLCPTEIYFEPVDPVGVLKVMLIVTPVLSRFLIPYFSSHVYRQNVW